MYEKPTREEIFIGVSKIIAYFLFVFSALKYLFN